MQAIYYDGKSSKPYHVEVSETHDGIQIMYNQEGSHFTKFWRLDDIDPESFNSGDKVILSYGEFPYEKLEIEGPDAHRFIKASLESESYIKNIYYQISQANPVKLVLVSFAFLVLFVYAYIFYISPFVGEKAVNIVPQDVEVKAGEVIYRNMSYMVDKDSVKSEMLLEFFDLCGFESDYPIRIDYSDSDIVNAFALPGGQIVIYKGLVDKTECWDELAALMAHELAHVNQRHSFKQLARSVSSYLILSVLTGDVAGASSVILENANTLNQMANSRIHEKEADITGLAYLKTSKIRPKAMMDLFERLMMANTLPEEIEKYKDKAESNLEFLSSHPLTQHRIDYIEELIDGDDAFDYRAVNIERAQVLWEALKEKAPITGEDN